MLSLNAAQSARLATLQLRLADYLAAESACLRNSRYKMPDGRELQRSDLRAIQSERRAVENEINALSGYNTPSRGRFRRGITFG